MHTEMQKLKSRRFFAVGLNQAVPTSYSIQRDWGIRKNHTDPPLRKIALKNDLTVAGQKMVTSDTDIGR